MTFAELGLAEPILRAVAEQGYATPTPIQVSAIPPVLGGRDLLGCAQTGTGKTAAFALPILNILAARPGVAPKSLRALILSPTRELAAQIGDNLVAYGRYLPLKTTVIFGGVSENPQIQALRRRTDILVATPGRLIDLLGRGFVDLRGLEFFVLDEADRMLDMGFIHDVRRIIQVLPAQRQNLLFSATMPPPIAALAAFLHDPIRVEVAPQATPVEAIEQRVMFVDRVNKRRLLADLLSSDGVDRAIVFTRTKHGANRLVEHLEKDGFVAAAIHGNKSQNARQRALEDFRDGSVKVLVATDLASRGIDIDDVTHVFNYELPNEPESYVHRIGRTGRAGRAGIAISLTDPDETPYLESIQRLLGEAIEPIMDHAYHCEAAMPRQRSDRGSAGGGGHRPSGGRPRGGRPGGRGR